MSAYEVIINLDSSTLENLCRTNLLRATVKRDVEIYSYYIAQKDIVGSMNARTLTAEKFFLCEDSISKIIQKMK